MNAAARELITSLALEPLAGEGGFFRPTWRSETASAILFLITESDFSALHRLAQDEIWFFHAGDPVEHVTLASGRDVHVARLGVDLRRGEQPQVAVPRGTWQAARLARSAVNLTAPSHGYALLSCTVSPPWDPNGFELGPRERLCREFPADAALVTALTR